MEPAAVGVEVGEKRCGGDGVVKSPGVFEIFVPDLIDGIPDEFYDGRKHSP